MPVVSAARIAVLPPAVADQIAAGEVVERPASVVKELVENAIDAGASSIEIVIEGGGRDRIRVSDDGSGMERDDAVLSLERHATSKIRTAADLVGVGSFGFRGEALAAICSVAHLEIETTREDGEGTAVTATAGAVESVRTGARRRGTTVTVSRLFFNAPARLKFMRGTRAEWRAVMEVVAAAALTRRDIRIVLLNDGKSVMTLAPASSLRERVGALYGAAFAERLLDLEDLSGTTHVSGLVERPADVGTASRRIFVCVNGRAVRDAGLLRAAEAAYRSTIPAGVRPTMFLGLVVAADGLDVNVHPAKAEVRFADRWHTERVVESAVRRALGTFEAGTTLGRAAWPMSQPPAPPVEVDRETLQPSRPETLDFASAQDESIPVPADSPSPTHPGPSRRSFAGTPLDDHNVPPLLQLRRTYIMFEHSDGVVLIDQHSAHERVLYEQLLRTLDCSEQPAQRLLLPLTLHLTPSEAEAFDEQRALFERMGFEIEGFGGHTLLIRSVPLLHPRFDAERCVRETLSALTGDRDPQAAARHERLAATIACKAAVKAGDALSPAELRGLFIDLRATTLPAHDVHGRSTIVRLTWDELERRFGRR